MYERDAGSPWVEGLTFGSTMGHAYLLAVHTETDPGWTTWLNVGGLAASVGTLIARMTYRTDVDDARPDEGGLHAFVRPGSNGTELGLLFRH